MFDCLHHSLLKTAQPSVSSKGFRQDWLDKGNFFTIFGAHVSYLFELASEMDLIHTFKQVCDEGS
jgi:hypothetical protein